MELEQQNRINMIAACLAVLDDEGHKSTWENQEPTAFGEEVAELRTRYNAARATGQKIQTPITGTTQLKADKETVLEDRAWTLSAPLRYHFRKTGDAENFAKVNYTESGIRELRHQDLVTTAKIIRDCGTAALAHADAAKHGFTQAKVTALSTAIDEFDALLSAPRAKITDRTTFVRELVTQLAACMTQLEMMDDLILSFAGTAAGDHLITAWNQARIIIDAGGGQGGEEPPPTPPTPPTP